MKRVLFQVYAFAVLLAGVMMGVFASRGFCAAIWGGKILDTALASPPDHSHPAFWVCLIAMVPAMLISIAGAFSLFVLLPAISSPSARLLILKTKECGILRRFAERLLRYVEQEEENNGKSVHGARP